MGRLRFSQFAYVIPALALAAPAYAQQTPVAAGSPPPTAEGGGSDYSEDIVVTALHRESSLQETPLAITAVTQERIRDLAVVDSRSLTRLAPGLVVTETNAGNNRFTIRSIGAAGEPTVGIYLDEIPLIGPPGTTNDAGSLTPSVRLFDIERVEVLRGPQGTLYGAGSMAGTIRFIAAKPKLDRYEGEVLARVSDINHGGMGYEVNAMANMPLVDGLLGLRVVGFYSDQDGYTDNDLLGIKNSNYMKTKGLRAALRFEPAPGLVIDGLFNFQDAKGVTPDYRYELGKYRADFAIRNRFSDNYKLYGLTANYDFNWAKLTATVSYSDRDAEYFWDSTEAAINSIAVPTACSSYFGIRTACSATQSATYAAYARSLGPTASNPPAHNTVFTQEARLAGSIGTVLDWTVGAFHSKRKAHIDSYNWPADPVTGEPIVTAKGYRFYRYIIDHLAQTAGFAEGTAHLTSELSVTAGARYYKYSKLTGGEVVLANPSNFTTKTPYSESRTSESGWIFKFGADYQISRDFMIYASASQGYRPGGINQSVGLPPDAQTYDADSLWNYEFGFKTSWLDRAVTFNGALYQIDWSNRQTSARLNGGAFGYIDNIGSARIRGVELELALRPTEGLEFNGSGSFNDGVLTEDQVSDLGTAPGKKGDKLDVSARWTWQLGAQYGWDLNSSLRGIARFDANYIGERWSTISRVDERNRLPGFWNTSARIGIRSEDTGWSLALYATNLFDVVGLQQRNAGSILVGYSQQRASSISPRTVGIEVDKSF